VLGDLDEFGGRVEEVQELLGLGLGKLLAELEAGGNVPKLGELLMGSKEREVSSDEELLENRELATDEEADPEVGINDDPRHAVPV